MTDLLASCTHVLLHLHPQRFQCHIQACSPLSLLTAVFFQDAIEHIARIARVLRQPLGNAMLAGIGGSGKQSLTRFAAHMGGFQTYQIELMRGYGAVDFREDLKKMYRAAGVDGEPVVFLFSDTQIVEEGFLEDINNLLNSGEVILMWLVAPDSDLKLTGAYLWCVLAGCGRCSLM